ncbi:hypothetical protein D3C72_2287840 [compost metagenome]
MLLIKISNFARSIFAGPFARACFQNVAFACAVISLYSKVTVSFFERKYEQRDSAELEGS